MLGQKTRFQFSITITVKLQLRSTYFKAQLYSVSRTSLALIIASRSVWAEETEQERKVLKDLVNDNCKTLLLVFAVRRRSEGTNSVWCMLACLG